VETPTHVDLNLTEEFDVRQLARPGLVTIVALRGAGGHTMAVNVVASGSQALRDRGFAVGDEWNIGCVPPSYVHDGSSDADPVIDSVFRSQTDARMGPAYFLLAGQSRTIGDAVQRKVSNSRQYNCLSVLVYHNVLDVPRMLLEQTDWWLICPTAREDDQKRICSRLRLVNVEDVAALQSAASAAATRRFQFLVIPGFHNRPVSGPIPILSVPVSRLPNDLMLASKEARDASDLATRDGLANIPHKFAVLMQKQPDPTVRITVRHNKFTGRPTESP
jgi:hypothetical protein